MKIAKNMPTLGGRIFGKKKSPLKITILGGRIFGEKTPLKIAILGGRIFGEGGSTSRSPCFYLQNLVSD